MRSQRLPIQASTLSSVALAPFIAYAYGLRRPVRCRLYRISINDTYKVEDAHGSYMFRVYRRGWRTKSEIEAELDLLTHLHENGIKVSVPARGRNGERIQSFGAPEGTRYGVLFTFVHGRPVFEMNTTQMGVLGRAVAELHGVADKLGRPLNRPRYGLREMVAIPLRQIKPYLAHRPKDYAYLKLIGAILARRIALLPQTPPAYGVCHWDVHAENLRFDERGKVHFFDFDCAGYSWRAGEMAGVLAGLVWNGKGKADWARCWNAFQGGYSRKRELSKAELSATPVLVPLNMLWVAGFHAYGTQGWGWGTINDAYFDHLIGSVRRVVRDFSLL